MCGTGTHVSYTRKNKVLVVEDDESWAKVRNRKHQIINST